MLTLIEGCAEYEYQNVPYKSLLEDMGIDTSDLSCEIQLPICTQLSLGDEFNERTTRHLSEDLNLGLGSQKRAGKKEMKISDCGIKINPTEARTAPSKKNGFLLPKRPQVLSL